MLEREVERLLEHSDLMELSVCCPMAAGNVIDATLPDTAIGVANAVACRWRWSRVVLTENVEVDVFTVLPGTRRMPTDWLAFLALASSTSSASW